MSLIQRIRAVSDLREARHITPHHSSLQTTATYLHTTEEAEAERRVEEQPEARRSRYQRSDRRRR